MIAQSWRNIDWKEKNSPSENCGAIFKADNIFLYFVCFVSSCEIMFNFWEMHPKDTARNYKLQN